MDWKHMFDRELNKTVDSSKKIFQKAKEQAKELGDQSILSLEIRQLDARHEELLSSLGSRVYELLVEGKQSTVSAKSSGVKEILEQLEETKKLLEEKRELHSSNEKKEPEDRTGTNQKAEESESGAEGEENEEKNEEKREE